MKRKPLHVGLRVDEPSVIEVTVGERVPLDRVTPSPHGYVAERHGCLLDPGVTTVALERGHYFFKTLSDTNLRVVRGGVAAGIRPGAKDGPIDPAVPLLDGKGDEASGELPSFTIERA